LNVTDRLAPTVADVVERFIAHKVDLGFWSQRTVERTGADLRSFANAMPDAPIDIVNVRWVRGFLERNAEHSLAYQRSRYHAVAEFLGWCVRKGYLKGNPCDGVDRSEKPWVGKRARRRLGRGKPQLSNQAEVIAYLAEATRLKTAVRRVAAALPLLCGLRSGETRHLQVWDVDFGGGKLWVRDVDDDDNVVDIAWGVKTAAGRRTVDIPVALVSELTALCQGRAADAFLFRSNRVKGRPYSRQWLNRMVTGVCERAGVRIVGPHGLRDTWSTLQAQLARLSAPDIGKLLGHADEGATAKRHYIGVPGHSAALRLVPSPAAPRHPLPQAGEGNWETK
jgi:integrase